MLPLILGLQFLQAKPLVTNPGFEDGLKGWKVEGQAAVETTAPLAGKASLHLGPGKSAVRQRYDVPGLRILYFGAALQANDAEAKIRLQCFDRKGKSLMDFTAGPDAKNNAGIYIKTHAFTSYVVLSIEKGAAGTLTADGVQLQDDDRDRVEHAPLNDLSAAMEPVWQGNRVRNESVLLLSNDGGPATGKLMFRAAGPMFVKDASLGTTYQEGRDYTFDGNIITAIKGSNIPVMSSSEFKKGEFPWTELQGRHVFVTYMHSDTWNGPVPDYQGDQLPETTKKLSEKKPLTIVAYGDSITLGINVSGFRNVPPYLPPWPTLVAHELGKKTEIKLYNTSLGGQTSQWAKDNAEKAVTSLSPDLVILAFGMNDFWSLTPKLFRENIEATMAIIRKKRPKVEFVLVASMKFDPVYTTDPTYVGNLAGYAKELQKMAGKGVAFLDMTTLTDALYRAKSAKDLATDPMHPDDFLARIYAQAMVATLVKN